MNKLLNLGAISHCCPEKGQFLSSVFTVPKPNGSHRFILNLKYLNEFILARHFKMEILRTVSQLLSKGVFLDKKFLRFQIDSSLFEFNVIPFGLCTAPWTFTKLLKPVMSFLRNQGLRSTIYLDDILCIGDTLRIA